jgi:hypothetical protein
MCRGHCHWQPDRIATSLNTGGQEPQHPLPRAQDRGHSNESPNIPRLRFFAGRTLSVAGATLAKSVMKVSSSIAKAETTNLPMKMNAMDTKAAFRIVRLIHDPGQHSLVDDPPLLDECQYIRQPCFRQDDAGRSFGHIACLLTAIPTSAWRKAGASLTPSPVIPVTCPAACRCCTTMYLSSGYTSANPSVPARRSTAWLPAFAPLP